MHLGPTAICNSRLTLIFSLAYLERSCAGEIDCHVCEHVQLLAGFAPDLAVALGRDSIPGPMPIDNFWIFFCSTVQNIDINRLAHCSQLFLFRE